MIDTHCHLTFPQLAEQVDDVIAAAQSAGVDRLITVGVTPDDAVAAQKIAENHNNVFFTAGVHPHYIEDVPLDRFAHLVEIAAHPRCVAFGEMGLDYHYPDPPKPLQHERFEAQLQLVAASRLGKPIILHCRKAVDDTLAILRSSSIPLDRFVFHCFTESPADARRILDAGSMLSFTGIATYKNAPDVQAAAKLTPDDRIMIETDSPYLTPEPHRKIRPNQPKFVADTARFLAHLRGSTLEAFDQLTTANAVRFFHLPTDSA